MKNKWHDTAPNILIPANKKKESETTQPTSDHPQIMHQDFKNPILRNKKKASRRNKSEVEFQHAWLSQDLYNEIFNQKKPKQPPREQDDPKVPTKLDQSSELEFQSCISDRSHL